MWQLYRLLLSDVFAHSEFVKEELLKMEITLTS